MEIHARGNGNERRPAGVLTRPKHFLGLLARLMAVIAMLYTPVSTIAAERPTIVAVNYPLAYFAERLAGGAAKVVLPVPSGRDPAFWRPTIADISRIQSADLILLNGAGFAAWTGKTSLPRSRTIDTSRTFRDRFIATETVTHSHGAEGKHSHTGTATFTWLDLNLAGDHATAVARGLGRILPDKKPVIDTRLAKLKAELSALDAKAHAIGKIAANRRLIVTHPRYQYFARAYGFEMRALAWDAGAAPNEAEWSALDGLIKETPKAIVLWEAAPPSEARERLRKQGVVDVVFPTRAMPPKSGDFVSAFKQQLDDLEAALKR